MISDSHDYGDMYATLILGKRRDNITFVDGHSNYDFLLPNHEQTKILSGFVARRISIFRGIEMIDTITPLHAQIPDEMKPIAKELVKELRKYLHESEPAGDSAVFQLLYDVAQEIDNELNNNLD
ncbi:MAG: hypothetical protein ACRD8Z_14270 [Nitrososphaeraceae archaeon]